MIDMEVLQSTDPLCMCVGGQTTTINDYNFLNNKPSIEGVPLIGDQTFEMLHMNALTNQELEEMLKLE